ncbi:MAG: hypothetical protein AB8B91_12440 [Rubripirellula sp.]
MKNLKQKLKAADRRRRKRDASVPASTPSPTAATSQPDVASLVSRAILGFVDGHQQATDTIVVAAIRSTLSGRAGSGELSAALMVKLEQILGREDVSTRAFRDALTQIQQMAADHKSEDDPLAFVHYLALLSA